MIKWNIISINAPLNEKKPEKFIVSRNNDEVKKKKDVGFVFCFLLLQVSSVKGGTGKTGKNRMGGLDVIKSTVGEINCKNS